MLKHIWPLGLVVPALAAFGALAGCGDDSSSTPAADSGHPETGSPDTGSDAPADTTVDSPADSNLDSGDGALVCDASGTVAYAQPGCGASAPAPYCQGPTDACLEVFCDCDGTTHAEGCGFALRPYAHAGACEDADAAAGDADSASDATPDGTTDGPFDSSPDTGDGGLVCGQDGALAYGQLAYGQPGCGASAPAPFCELPGDAIACSYCDCSGATVIAGCNGPNRPFAHAGACNGDSGTD
jgi:hypothetical protein